MLLLNGEPGFMWAAAAAALAAMPAITLIGDVPRNRRTEQFPEDGSLEEWRTIRVPGAVCTSRASRWMSLRSPRSSSHRS
ncbi:MAG TPA: hypothetical protein VK891_08970 [Euzebyales bacterium]|nr:hypothetical protein [Euzebyales bacterium]